MLLKVPNTFKSFFDKITATEVIFESCYYFTSQLKSLPKIK